MPRSLTASRPRNARAAVVAPGSAAPLGATVCPEGVNFSVYSRDAERLELLLFETATAPEPCRSIPLDPRKHRTYHYWHVFVPGLGPGQAYGWRAHGPFQPDRGWRFDGQKVLLDPYGLAVAVPPEYRRDAAREPGDNAPHAMRSVVVDPDAYDWEGDAPLRRPFAATIVYELHVRGFTRHPSSGVAPGRAGTYAGLIEKIPYLKDLGITAVELLPVFQFDPHDAPGGRPNYWGYQPVSFFAPHHAYASVTDPTAVLDEFRDMVKALHRAGLEVILDVVFNHTTEGGASGPTLCHRGLANDAYYILGPDRARYADYTGCGNTLNANHPIVRRMIQDSLRHWVTRMHVDGFRFDLASILSRDGTGKPLPHPPVLWDIESDPVLAGTKLIAEAWDAAGLYQVGSFVGDSWHEWNGKFRDDIRSFVKGDPGTVSRLATRLLGSPDLFAHEEREAEQSINFVTCHDGFTLNDLVSYNDKHNEANGEDNRDGATDNLSWNCGIEGATEDREVEALRHRQVKNFLALLMLAAGTPMILMGDEVRRSQQGNNNAYCLDHADNWFDWSLAERHQDLLQFVRLLNRFRQNRDVVAEGDRLTLNELLRRARIQWHGVKLDQPDWAESSRSLAFTLQSLHGRITLHGMINAYWEPLVFELPAPPGSAWRRCIDTALAHPEDASLLDSAPEVQGRQYRVESRSVVVLACKRD